MARRGKSKVSQAWIELLADDPEAISALTVAPGSPGAGAAPHRH